MAWKTARDDEHRVDPDVVARPHESRREQLRGSHDAPEAPRIERYGRGVVRRAGFHFDKRERSTPPRDNIHFPTIYTGSPSQNSPSVQPQSPAGQALRTTAALFSCLPVHLERSRAIA